MFFPYQDCALHHYPQISAFFFTKGKAKNHTRRGRCSVTFVKRSLFGKAD